MMKKILLGIIIGGLIFGGIVYAASYKASDVSYSNDKTSATNVHGALDDLYNIKQELIDIKSLGNAASSEIAKGQTAVVQGQLVTGTMEEKQLKSQTVSATWSNVGSGTSTKVLTFTFNQLSSVTGITGISASSSGGSYILSKFSAYSLSISGNVVSVSVIHESSGTGHDVTYRLTAVGY